jgi:hypothetical protein
MLKYNIILIYFAGKVATEARDLLDYDVLTKRIQKLEKVSLSSVPCSTQSSKQ